LVAHIGLICFACFEDIFLHIFSLGWRFVLWFLMTLTLPPIPTDFVPLVGKPPRYTIRRLPYPGNTRPYYQYLKDFDIEVPDVPEGVDPSDPNSGYDWKGLLSHVFDFEKPEEALEWATLGIVEVIDDLKEGRSAVTDCADAVSKPASEADEEGQGLTRTSKDLMEASSLWDKVVWRYWLWCLLYARIPTHILHDMRVTAMDTDLQGVKADVGSLRAQVSGLDGKLDAMMRLLQEPGGGQGTSHSPMPSFAPKTRPPAPIFIGSKDGTKITTWFQQFSAYAALLQLTPDTLVDHASLCLIWESS
jgi:hypothetical protein